MKKKLTKFLLLIFILIINCSCAGSTINNSNDSFVNSSSSQEDNNIENSNLSFNNTSEQPSTNQQCLISYNYEDYMGDIETFAYGLIINRLELLYDVFPAYVELSNTECIYGLAYTDYSKCYANDDETEVYFFSGFITFVGELEISEEEFNTGLLIYNLDFQSENTMFIWSYKCESFFEHCVVFGKYLTYGVDNNGKIFYNAIDYMKGYCDESLGSLYSYDESRYVFDIDFGDYIPVSGISLSESIDYISIQKELEEYIEKQNFNYSSVSIQSIVYSSQHAVESYLMSLQQETFLGVNVNELIEASKRLNPLECFRFTSNGISIINIEQTPPEQPTLLVKWLVGTGCAILTAAGIVGSVIFVECPALSALSGVITGAAMQIFMDVVITNKTLNDVDWRKVGVAAIAGAISGFVGPYLQTLGGLAYNIVDTLVDGVIGGLDAAVCSLMDGNSWNEAIKSFGWGVVTGCVISGGLKALGSAVSAMSKGISKGVQKLSEKLSPKLTATITKFVKPVKNFGNAVGTTIGKMQEKANSSIFHSKYIGQKIAFKQLNRLIKNNPQDLAKKSIMGQGSLSPNGILDNTGKNITKKELYDIFMEANDGEIIGKYILNGETINIVKKNGVASIFFDNKYQSVALKYGITFDRDSNLETASELFRNEWMDDSSKIPTEIKGLLQSKFPDQKIEDILENITDKSLRNIISQSSWVLHENIDLITVTLVPRALHDKVRGYKGISHIGGVSLAEYIKQQMGSIYFDRFISAAANGFVIVN